MAAAIQPERILRELGELWTNMAQSEPDISKSAGVLRACAMTLIVAAQDEADAQAASEALGELMHEHPSRAIVLKPSPTGRLDARVFAQCWMPFGSRQQICCEQIEIAAGTDRLGDVPGLMLGLLAPDLPVVLWCRGARWFGEPHFGQLLPLIEKLIVDSAGFPDCVGALNLIAELIHDGNRVADLAWSRITGLREVIAHAFESPAERQRLLDTKAIQIRLSAPSVESHYLAAWLQLALPKASIQWEQAADSEAAMAVTLNGICFQSFKASPGTVPGAGAVPGDREHTAFLPPPGDNSPMRDELAITRRDLLFEEVFARARKLATSH